MIQIWSFRLGFNTKCAISCEIGILLTCITTLFHQVEKLEPIKLD